MEKTNERLLPDKLKSGTVLCSPGGGRGVVVRTSLRDPVYDTTQYRLRYETPYGSVLSTKLWTRDQLQEAGCVVEET